MSTPEPLTPQEAAYGTRRDVFDFAKALLADGTPEAICIYAQLMEAHAEVYGGCPDLVLAAQMMVEAGEAHPPTTRDLYLLREGADPNQPSHGEAVTATADQLEEAERFMFGG